MTKISNPNTLTLLKLLNYCLLSWSILFNRGFNITLGARQQYPKLSTIGGFKYSLYKNLKYFSPW